MTPQEMQQGGPVLFCFDGSDGSRAAMATAAGLLAPTSTIVLTVWETVILRLMSNGLAAAHGVSYGPDEVDLDSREQTAAREAANHGARAASEHGWAATARVEQAETAVWKTVVEVADEVDAALIVCGARGVNMAKRAIFGSVSEAVLHHSQRPTLISPPGR